MPQKQLPRFKSSRREGEAPAEPRIFGTVSARREPRPPEPVEVISGPFLGSRDRPAPPFSFQQMPIKGCFMVPFVPLAEFSAHEYKFFPWLGIHVSEQEPEVCEFLPFIAGHSGKQ